MEQDCEVRVGHSSSSYVLWGAIHRRCAYEHPAAEGPSGWTTHVAPQAPGGGCDGFRGGLCIYTFSWYCPASRSTCIHPLFPTSESGVLVRTCTPLKRSMPLARKAGSRRRQRAPSLASSGGYSLLVPTTHRGADRAAELHGLRYRARCSPSHLPAGRLLGRT